MRNVHTVLHSSTTITETPHLCTYEESERIDVKQGFILLCGLMNETHRRILPHLVSCSDSKFKHRPTDVVRGHAHCHVSSNSNTKNGMNDNDPVVMRNLYQWESLWTKRVDSIISISFMDSERWCYHSYFICVARCRRRIFLVTHMMNVFFSPGILMCFAEPICILLIR